MCNPRQGPAFHQHVEDEFDLLLIVSDGLEAVLLDQVVFHGLNGLSKQRRICGNVFECSKGLQRGRLCRSVRPAVCEKRVLRRNRRERERSQTGLYTSEVQSCF
jgi:hypothetical protein